MPQREGLPDGRNPQAAAHVFLRIPQLPASARLCRVNELHSRARQAARREAECQRAIQTCDPLRWRLPKA